MVPGNHEFDFGPEIFRARMAEVEVPGRLVEHPRGGRQPAGQHRRREDRRGRGHQDRLLRADHRGHAGPGDDRRREVRLLHRHRPGQGRGAARGRRGFRRRGRPYAARRRHAAGARRRRRPRPLRPRRASAHLLRRQDGADRILQPGRLRRRHRSRDRQDRGGRQGRGLLAPDLRDHRHRVGVEPDPEIAAVVQGLHRQARRGAEGRDRHDGDAARQPPRHGARRRRRRSAT